MSSTLQAVVQCINRMLQPDAYQARLLHNHMCYIQITSK